MNRDKIPTAQEWFKTRNPDYDYSKWTIGWDEIFELMEEYNSQPQHGNKVSENDVVKKFTEQVLDHNIDLEFVDIVNKNFWDLLPDGINQGKEECKTKVVDFRKYIAEELTRDELIDRLCELHEQYMDLREKHLFPEVIWKQL